MVELRLPDNIKVHFAACEVTNQYLTVKYLGVRYALYTAFPFVERMTFDKPRTPVMPLRWMTNPAYDIPHFIMDNSLHVIQDSGIFTLMFGARAGKHDRQIVTKYYDNLIKFTNDNAKGVTCVEVDCQKILGVDAAWEFRERMRGDLPNNRIINVFHLEDGRNGLDRMIEYSDYIALSIPELRKTGRVKYTYSLARYVKSRKPAIDIHLLGCTQLDILKHTQFCTSCDSTSYTAPKRYGYLNGKHVWSIDTAKVRAIVGNQIYDKIAEYNSEINTNNLLLSVYKLKQDYQNVCGNQDYYAPLNQ